MTFYESNRDVRATGAEIEEFVDIPLVVDEQAPTAGVLRAAGTDTRSPDPHLRIYLNDHRAGAAGGVALARRCQKNNETSELGTTMRTIVDEFTTDAEMLTRIADRFGIPINPLKTTAVRVGELLGRLKTNGHLREYSPLSRLLELEALLAGIDAKRSLWRSLLATSVPMPLGVDLRELEQRASKQRDVLRPFHAEAARDALVNTV
jgi:hypothetical protein